MNIFFSHLNIRTLVISCLLFPLSVFSQKKDEVHVEAVYQKAVGLGVNYYFNVSKGEKKHIADHNMYNRLLFSNHFIVGGSKYMYSKSEKSIASVSIGYQYAPGLGLFTFYTNVEARLVYNTNFRDNNMRAEFRVGTDLLFPCRIQLLYSPHIGGKIFDGISNFGVALMYSLSPNKYVKNLEKGK